MKITVCLLLLVTQVLCETSSKTASNTNKVAPSKTSSSAVHTKGASNGYVPSTQTPNSQNHGSVQNPAQITQPMQLPQHVRGVLVPVRTVQRPVFLIAQPAAPQPTGIQNGLGIQNGVGQHSEQFQQAVRELLNYYESNPQARYQLLNQQHGPIYNSPQYVVPTSASQPPVQSLAQLQVPSAQLQGQQTIAHLAIPANLGHGQTTATAYLIPASSGGHQQMFQLASGPQHIAQQYQVQIPQQESVRGQYQFLNGGHVAKSPNTEGMRIVPAPHLDRQRPNYIPTPSNQIPQYFQGPPTQSPQAHHYIPQASANQLHQSFAQYLAQSNSIAPQNFPQNFQNQQPHFIQSSSASNNVPHYIPALANGQLMLGPGLYQALSQGNIQGVPQNHGNHGHQRHARDYMKSTAVTPMARSSHYHKRY